MKRETPPPNAAEGIRDVVVDAGVALATGNRDATAERFIDYWMGTGTWVHPIRGGEPRIERIY